MPRIDILKRLDSLQLYDILKASKKHLNPSYAGLRHSIVQVLKARGTTVEILEETCKAMTLYRR